MHTSKFTYKEPTYVEGNLYVKSMHYSAFPNSSLQPVRLLLQVCPVQDQQRAHKQHADLPVQNWIEIGLSDMYWYCRKTGGKIGQRQRSGEEKKGRRGGGGLRQSER